MSGRVGLRRVDPGSYVSLGEPIIVVITQLKPISVDISVPEDDISQIIECLSTVDSLPIIAFNRGSNRELARGTLRTLDNQIDTTTGTLRLRADFSNERGILFPNQFVNVTLLVDTLHDATVIPTAAVQRGAPGTFVYVVDADDSVKVRPVVLGPASSDRIAVTGGLSLGERVVTDGADKLHNGAKVALRTAPPKGGTEAPTSAANPPVVGSMPMVPTLPRAGNHPFGGFGRARRR